MTKQKKSGLKSAFGKLRNIPSTYSLTRGSEHHTKTIDIPSPFHGKLTIDDTLEPSEYLLLEFKGIHDSYYIGINDIGFYDGEGQEVAYENVAVDGVDVDHGDVHPVMPANGWWAVGGAEHSLLFKFANPKQHIKQVKLHCANASATPKYLHVTDGKTPTSSYPNPRFSSESVFQIAGETEKDPSNLRFYMNNNKLAFSDVIDKLNASPPANGFCSLFSTCKMFVFVFYKRGLRTRAMNYYFGSNPTDAYDLACSVTGSSNGGVNNKVEQRAMTLAELQAVRAVILSNCIANKWKSSRDGSLLRPEDVNLYDFNALVIKPLTKSRKCSFKELFPSGPATPTFYTSHWWGENILDFVRCCEVHAYMHGLSPTEAKYWVCAHANRQHDLGQDLGENPDESSFRRAMDAADGVVLIIDPKSVVYSRIWVDFELFKTTQSKHSSIDMVTHHEGDVHLLASKSFGEGPYQRNKREMMFPYKHVCAEALTVALEDGEASKEIDKVRILNYMAGKTDDFNNKAALKALSNPMRSSMVDFQKDKSNYDKVNHALRGEFGVKCLSAALLTEGHGLENFYGHDLLDIVGGDTARTNLTMELLSIDAVDDAVVGQLMGLCTGSLEKLTLNIVGCQNVTDDALHSIELPDSLTGLHLHLGMCKQFTNEGVIAAITKLPPKLTHLTLDVRAHKKSDGSYSPSRRNNHLEAIANHLPSSLVEFDLNTTLTSSEDGTGFEKLARGLPRDLQEFSLDVESYEGFTGGVMAGIAAELPVSLKKLNLKFWGGDYWEVSEVERFAGFIRGMEDLVEFSASCTDNGKLGYYRTRKFTSVRELLSS